MPKWSPDYWIILAKYQLCHSYTFWTMHILIFSPVQIIMRHPPAEVVQFRRHRRIHMLKFCGIQEVQHRIKVHSSSKCYLLKVMQYILPMKRKECSATLSNFFFCKVKPLVILGNAGVPVLYTFGLLGCIMGNFWNDQNSA